MFGHFKFVKTAEWSTGGRHNLDRSGPKRSGAFRPKSTLASDDSGGRDQQAIGTAAPASGPAMMLHVSVPPLVLPLAATTQQLKRFVCGVTELRCRDRTGRFYLLRTQLP